MTPTDRFRRADGLVRLPLNRLKGWVVLAVLGAVLVGLIAVEAASDPQYRTWPVWLFLLGLTVCIAVGVATLAMEAVLVDTENERIGWADLRRGGRQWMALCDVEVVNHVSWKRGTVDREFVLLFARRGGWHHRSLMLGPAMGKATRGASRRGYRCFPIPVHMLGREQAEVLQREVMRLVPDTVPVNDPY